jgi:hypothetical protein
VEDFAGVVDFAAAKNYDKLFHFVGPWGRRLLPVRRNSYDNSSEPHRREYKAHMEYMPSDAVLETQKTLTYSILKKLTYFLEFLNDSAYLFNTTVMLFLCFVKSFDPLWIIISCMRRCLTKLLSSFT